MTNDNLILIAEDDCAIMTALSDILMLEGYDVICARDGAEALEKFKNTAPRLILLDVMMPKMSGYDVCREIRRQDERVPILMLTAKGEEIDKVVGLELGADDYIVKPFGVSELTARIRSALRRAALFAPPSARVRSLCFGEATVDLDGMTVVRDGESSPLTPKEAELLEYLAHNEGRAVSRETLLEEVWGIDCEITTRSIDQHILRLRQKLEPDPAAPIFIHTVHGVGYRIERLSPPQNP